MRKEADMPEASPPEHTRTAPTSIPNPVGGAPLRSLGFRALLATQFLGAFNDNAFKLLVQLLAIRTLGEEGATGYVALGAAMLTIPFVVFSASAGFLADRFSKKTIMIWVKKAEILIMVAGGVALGTGHLKAALAVLFFMGAQSTFFSPAKYGVLPEILPEGHLSRGNGVIQMWTVLAIIAGTAVGGQLSDAFEADLHLASAVLVVLAILGTMTSLFITPVPAAGSKKEFRLNFLSEALRSIIEIRRDRPLFLCVLGSAFFWFAGALFQMNVLIYAKAMLHVPSDAAAGYLLAAVGLGIGVGSVLAGRWSGGKVEFGLVPLGAIGMGVFAISLAFSYHSYWLTLVLLALLGISGGLYNIPLQAYIQQKSPKDSRGRVLATSNFISFSGMIFAAAAFWFLLNVLGLNTAHVFATMGVASFLVIWFVIRTLPEFLFRFLVWLFTHALYRIRIVGQENVPREGGVLLVCNHVSYVDWALLQACIQRFIRFVMAKDYYDRRWLNPFCRLMQAIPVSAEDGPKKLLATLREASRRLENGEVVCIFAEGAITRTGNMLPFSRGLEVVMKGADVPIIPVYLDKVWGSIFSFEGGRILNRIPERVPYPVTVAFGEPLPATSTAFDVRSAVAEVGAEAVRERKNTYDLLPLRFLKQARRHPFRRCMVDSTGVALAWSRAAVAALALSRALRRLCDDDEEMVGLMLPNSCAAALANIALSLLGKCPVNLNYTASAEAMDSAATRCGIRHILTSRRFLEHARLAERPETVFLEDIRERVSAGDRALGAVGFWLMPRSLIRRVFQADRTRHVGSVATVIFSSGSTGEPKGIMLSHGNINSNVEGLFQVSGFVPDDVVLGALPFFHSAGLTGGLWLPLTAGFGVAYHPNPLDFKGVGELVEKHRVSVLTATPTFLMGYARKCTKEQFASLRRAFVGAEKLKPRIADLFRRKFGVEPLEGYGCTELSPFVSMNTPDVVSDDIHQVGVKPGSIGHPLPGVAVRTVDPDTFESVPEGQEGLLLVKGPNVMLGYLHDEARTRDVLRNGWYVTGDLASIGSDGFVTVHDRLSRFSKIAGEMVPHILIEEEIHKALGVVGEQVCVVTSVPDERKGERLVVLHAGEMDVAAVLAALPASGLPNLWIPRREMFFRIDDIPMLGSGKLDLKRIRALGQEACNGSEDAPATP